MSNEFKFPGMNKVPLDELLNNEYPEILKAIKKEGYNLDFMDYDNFIEITYENQVVGFLTLKYFLFSQNHRELMEAYIIPEYRGNNLLFDNLLGLLMSDNFEFYPRKPNKAFIKVLLKNDLAFELAPNFIVSYLKFTLDADDIYKNPKIKKFYKNVVDNVPYDANLFDMNLCSVMFNDSTLTLVKYSDFFALCEPRKYDLKKYNCRKKLKKVNEKYIDTKFSVWDNSSEQIDDFIQKTHNELSSFLGLENQVGSDNELDKKFIQILGEYGLSIDDGFKIRKHLADKLQSGQLNEKSYSRRAQYLLTNFDEIDKEIGEYDETIEECPFCGFSIHDNMRSCLKCGLNIREIDFDEYVFNKLNETVELLSNISEEGFDFLEADKVKIEDDDTDEISKLKDFYNEFMLSYKYDDFYDFYNSSDKNMNLDEIRELFVEDQLNKDIGTENEFNSFLNYTVDNSYYFIDTGRYEDAFINLIQLSILASNKSKDKNNILESNPHSIDIFMIINELESADYSFDISRLFDEAINTFKINKYNNNHEEVLKELKEIF